MTTSNPQPRFPTPIPFQWIELIDTARQSNNPIPPATAATRGAAHRAISTAYYATFHALKESIANTIINQPTSRFAADHWTKVYRDGSHRRIRDSLYNNRQQMSHHGSYFAAEYRDIYNARIQADYNPRAVFTSQDADTWIDQAEAAIRTLHQLPEDERGAMFAIIILGNR